MPPRLPALRRRIMHRRSLNSIALCYRALRRCEPVLAPWHSRESVERCRADSSRQGGHHGDESRTHGAPPRRHQAWRRNCGSIDAYWRACNYLAAGMIYLQDNPLLREPLQPEHIKNRLLGHWGASPGLSFTYVHLNRLINKYDLDAIFLAGPGHGAPGVLAPVYLEGTYAEIYPNKGEDLEGMRRVLQAVLVPGRHRQPLHARDAGIDPRGRRARLQRLARVRRGLRQSRPARGRGRRRRRVRDRPARHRLALEQVPEPGARRRGAAGAAPERLQDQQPDDPRAHLARGARRAVPRLRLDAAFRRGRRPGDDAPADGRDDGALRAGHPRASRRRRAAAARPCARAGR